MGDTVHPLDLTPKPKLPKLVQVLLPRTAQTMVFYSRSMAAPCPADPFRLAAWSICIRPRDDRSPLCWLRTGRRAVGAARQTKSPGEGARPGQPGSTSDAAPCLIPPRNGPRRDANPNAPGPSQVPPGQVTSHPRP